MKFREIEKIILADGWTFKSAKGSHHQYVHPTKPGKVTIPCHSGDIAHIIVRAILKQAGL
ncbi:MAG: type II toxin-antitoxin system HicA family toxin [Oscillospiraceae bacterium]|jgi:predicted RNA binding protein YcfA (HicA-like mRNA interferase family)|nr:type II toxin-antitoxin system HicA family toxin [Oscillospiraceae bacterium]